MSPPQTVLVKAQLNNDENQYELKFQIAPNAVNALLGQTGSGKTTLFRNLSGTLHKSCTMKSQISNFKSKSEKRQNIEYLPQCDTFLPHYKDHTVRQILEIFHYATEGKHISDDAMRSLLMRMNLNVNEIPSQKYSTLSGGEKVRVRLTTLLMSNKPIWILDEVLSGLDSLTGEKILQDIANVAKTEEKCVLISIHNPSKRHFEQCHDIVFVMQTNKENKRSILRCCNPKDHPLLEYKPQSVMGKYPKIIDIPPFEQKKMSFCETFFLVTLVSYRYITTTCYELNLNFIAMICSLSLVIISLCYSPRHWLVVYYSNYLYMSFILGVLIAPITRIFANIACECKRMVIRRMQPLNPFAIIAGQLTMNTVYLCCVNLIVLPWTVIMYFFFMGPVAKPLYIVVSINTVCFSSMMIIGQIGPAYHWFVHPFEGDKKHFFGDIVLMFMMTVLGGMTPPLKLLTSQWGNIFSYCNPGAYGVSLLTRALLEAYQDVNLNTDIDMMKNMTIGQFMNIIDADIPNSFIGGLLSLILASTIFIVVINVMMMYAVITALNDNETQDETNDAAAAGADNSTNFENECNQV